jgi:hypothetical protein
LEEVDGEDAGELLAADGAGDQVEVNDAVSYVQQAVLEDAAKEAGAAGDEDGLRGLHRDTLGDFCPGANHDQARVRSADWNR